MVQFYTKRLASSFSLVVAAPPLVIAKTYGRLVGFKQRLGGEVAAYVRVSSRAQTHATQRAAIEQAATARRDASTAWFSEKRTGTKLARPELDEVRARARAGKLPRLYVFRLGRLTRFGIRDTLSVVDEFRRHGELVTVADGFDLAGPGC